ncbi:transcription termination factor Rho [Sciscionella sediminilitoris]|uniref:transcription termination factor Rho n=1 Tax=Sciscionella sediminilitoris TaxID=1445613 RepID=UPI0004DF7EC1|nr:transcription termination factor Rho [Sciscionella sp. SE31]
MTNTELLSGSETESTASQGEGDKARAATKSTTARRKTGGLSGMVLAELRELAGELGITGTTGMRKGDLIAAIKERQGGGSQASAATSTASAGTAKRTRKTTGSDGAQLPFGEEPAQAEKPRESEAGKNGSTGDAAPKAEKPESPKAESPKSESKAESLKTDSPKTDSKAEPQSANGKPVESATRQDGGERSEGGGRRRRRSGRGGGGGEATGNEGGNRENNNRENGNRDNNNRDGNRDNNRDNGGNRDNRDNNKNNNNSAKVEDDEDGGGRRGRRYRDRRRGRNRGEGGGNPDTEIREDDVLLPVAGILDVLDNYAFVRTSGYLPGPNDVYVSLSLVRRFGMRRGDAITGVIKQPREGEQQRQKFNPLVRVDTVNGVEPDQAKRRPEFGKLTPLYPNERIRLETEQNKLTTRVIDLIMPVGKGQRALIQAPPKAGKTTILQDIANAIATNNPECYLMVVLVDERPEEVTDMQRSIKGEVIASTFDRPPSDHTSVAELSIERAKRLVEMGNDVVVMLDSITRLGRAYNNSSPASGRILSGGVDSTALYPPKRFLGAARNIEDGGSLTIFATAMVETGSTGDTVIFEEFKGTGNAELKLDRKIAERRLFPAVDVIPSGTRKDELLLSPDEYAVNQKLRRVLGALDSQQAIDTLLHQLRKTRNNVEFLLQISKTTPGMDND